MNSLYLVTMNYPSSRLPADCTERMLIATMLLLGVLLVNSIVQAFVEQRSQDDAPLIMVSYVLADSINDHCFMARMRVHFDANTRIETSDYLAELGVNQEAFNQFQRRLGGRIKLVLLNYVPPVGEPACCVVYGDRVYPRLNPEWQINRKKSD